MIRKGKKFEWPRKLYDKPRILEENKLVEQYGLKNKKEIWKTESKIKYLRNRAKALITAGQDEQGQFFRKLNKIGLKVQTIADVLALNKEDLLKRRLSSVVWKKKLADTARQARQMIVHKKIQVGDRVVNAPSYIVEVSEENLISIKKKIKKQKNEIQTEESNNPEDELKDEKNSEEKRKDE
ncbi:MAG: 30S ribosomal protein S4 [Candidatus Pacearchaeota archaeon]|nr:30S ribosomal protein S4 [Candidatus Pacearchaeota archaeon]